MNRGHGDDKKARAFIATRYGLKSGVGKVTVEQSKGWKCKEEIMGERKRMHVGFIVAALCMTGLLESAIAAPPVGCQDMRGERAYYLGFLKAENLVEQAFNGIDRDCMQVVEDTYFKDTVINIFKDIGLYPNASSFITCHFVGYKEGVASKLQEIQDECIQVCVNDGTFIGTLVSQFYCELAIALGGLGMADYITEGDLTLCGEAMVEACENTFATETVGYIGILGDACLPYTGDDPWNLAMHNQCVYNPVEPDAGVDASE